VSQGYSIIIPFFQESLREKSQALRKHVQENESLEFRNQQLSKRVALLQEEISSPTKKKKKVLLAAMYKPGLAECCVLRSVWWSVISVCFQRER
jgi:regulator of replication initiation timing